jgi:hypothetical protein
MNVSRMTLSITIGKRRMNILRYDALTQYKYSTCNATDKLQFEVDITSLMKITGVLSCERYDRSNDRKSLTEIMMKMS